MRTSTGSKAESKQRRGSTGKKTKPASEPKSTVPIMGVVTWTDPQKKPEAILLEVEYDPRDDRGDIFLSVNLRSVASIELRPFRRPLLDDEGRVDSGHVEDAMRLANA